MKKFLKILAIGITLCLLPFLSYADTGTDLVNAQEATDAAILSSFGGGSTSTNMVIESRKISLTHIVLRRSSFELDVVQRNISKLISDDSTGLVAKVEVENNTLDGYKLTLFSANKGKLMSLNNDDGQQNIDYDLTFNWAGSEIPNNDFQIVGFGGNVETAIGGSSYQSHNVGDKTYGKLDIILKDNNGNVVESPTDMEADIILSMSNSDKDRTKMAGAYSDTLVFVYEDL